VSCASPSIALPPLRVTRGASRAWLFTVNLVATGAPQDLTGALVWFTVKGRLEDVAAAITKANSAAGGVDNQVLIITPQTGISVGAFKVFLTPADTSPLSPRTYWCDAFVQLPGSAPINRQQVMANRQLVVDPAVTTVFT